MTRYFYSSTSVSTTQSLFPKLSRRTAATGDPGLLRSPSLDGRRAIAYLFSVAARKCPSCRKSIDEAESGNAGPGPFHPFCSQRCRSAGLGNWLNAAYRISAPVAEEDLDQGLPEGMGEAGPSSRDPDVN